MSAAQDPYASRQINQSLKPTDYRAVFQEVLRLRLVSWRCTIAVSHVWPAVVVAFQSRLAREVVSRVASAA